MSAADHRDAAGHRRVSRATSLALVAAGGLLIVASGLLWMRFGAEVFLDAAANLWKTCF